VLLPGLAAAAPVTQRPPGPGDNAAAGYLPGDFWVAGQQVFQNTPGGWQVFPLPSPYPVDAIGGDLPAACYGTGKLRAAYTGPLLRVVNPQTQAAADIFALPSGALDRGALDLGALRAAMHGADYVQVETLYDQCGHNDATQPNPANRPDISPRVSMGSGLGIALDGSTMQGIAKNMILPKSLAWRGLTASSQVAVVEFRAWFEENASISVLEDAHPPAKYSTGWGYGSSSAYYVTITADDLVALHALNTKPSPRAPATPFVTGYVSGGDGTSLWMDNFRAQTPVHFNPRVAGGMIGGSEFLPSFGYIDLAELLIYSRALTPAEQARANAASYRAFGLTPQLRDTIDIVGDSIGEGHGSQLNLSWPRQMLPLLHRPYVLSNASIAGISAAAMRPLASLVFFERGFLNGNARRVVFLDLGSNDLVAQAKAPDIYNNLCKIVMNAHRAGAKVIIATILPRGGLRLFGTPPGDDETQRLTLNTMLRANRAGADALVDFAADPIMGSYQAVLNPADYKDTIHPTTQGYVHLAADAAQALNRLDGD
jgi:lysophospholipase L1-like esterase